MESEILRKIADPGLGQGRCKMTLEYLVIPDSKPSKNQKKLGTGGSCL
jgi:hypothetical protein